jgi:hypothetical protein
MGPLTRWSGLGECCSIKSGSWLAVPSVTRLLRGNKDGFSRLHIET